MRSNDVVSDGCTRLNVKLVCYLVAVMLVPGAVMATQPSTRLIPRVKGYLNSPYGFWEYLPSGYHRSGSYPLVIYLHGIKELGNGQTVEELERVARNGIPRIIRKFERDFPFIMIAPQSPAVSEGFSTENIESLINIIEANYGVDKDRIYVTGVSYGGFAVWRLAS